MKNRNKNLLGWILFVISTIGFIKSGAKIFWAMFVTIIFLIVCLIFLIPFFRKETNET